MLIDKSCKIFTDYFENDTYYMETCKDRAPVYIFSITLTFSKQPNMLDDLFKIATAFLHFNEGRYGEDVLR